MGLIDFLFGKYKDTPLKKTDKPIIDARQEYDRIKRETEILEKENRQWSKEFNNTIATREKALQLEKEGKLFEALDIYLDSINKDENSKKLTIYNYAFDIDRVIVLYGKTKQKEKLKPFLEENVGSTFI
jgi:soluble cytochrome b562